jgi:hypothetical protein
VFNKLKVKGWNGVKTQKLTQAAFSTASIIHARDIMSTRWLEVPTFQEWKIWCAHFRTNSKKNYSSFHPQRQFIIVCSGGVRILREVTGKVNPTGVTTGIRLLFGDCTPLPGRLKMAIGCICSALFCVSLHWHRSRATHGRRGSIIKMSFPSPPTCLYVQSSSPTLRQVPFQRVRRTKLTYHPFKCFANASHAPAWKWIAQPRAQYII